MSCPCCFGENYYEGAAGCAFGEIEDLRARQQKAIDYLKEAAADPHVQADILTESICWRALKILGVDPAAEKGKE